jgi:hypothetical protein
MPNKSRSNSKSSSKSSSKSKSKSSSSSKSKTWRKVKPKLRVRINTAENKTRKYSLSSSERNEKKAAIKRQYIEPCATKQGYPCMLRGAVIENEEELHDFIEMNAHKSGKVIQKHLNDTRNELFRQGKYAKRIPPEYRLYDINTGKIYDLRNL